MVGKVGERGGEVEETELVLVGRLILPPNDPSRVLLEEVHYSLWECGSEHT